MRKELGTCTMTPAEIKEKIRKNLDALLFYQSIGTYNRDKIDGLKAERRHLQEICPHEHIDHVVDNFTKDSYTICTDCGKVLIDE